MSKLHSTTTNENGKTVSKGGNEKLTIGLNVGNKNIATIDFTEEHIKIWYEGNHYWSTELLTSKKQQSEMRPICNICGEGTHVHDEECTKCQSTDVGYID